MLFFVTIEYGVHPKIIIRIDAHVTDMDFTHNTTSFTLMSRKRFGKTRKIHRIPLSTVRTLDRMHEVQFLVDLSGSMSSFLKGSLNHTLIPLIVGLCDIENMRMAIQTFNSEVLHVEHFSEDKERLIDVVRHLECQEGVTNYLPPLLNARDMFFNSPSDTRCTQQTIVIVSDGNTPNADEVEQLCSDLKNQGVLIVMLGVGKSVSHDHLVRFASPGCDFLHSFSSDWKNNLIYKVEDEQEQTVRVKFFFDTLGEMGRNCSVFADVTNTGNRVIRDLVIVIRESKYFRQSVGFLECDIRPGETVSVPLMLRVKNCASAYDLAKSYCLEFEVRSRRHIVFSETNCVFLDERMFMVDILELQCHPLFRSLNIGMLGLSGVGKSTLIKRIFHLFHWDESITGAETSQAHGSNPRSIRHYELTTFAEQRLTSKLKLLDCWDISKDGSHRCSTMLKAFIQGFLYDGFSSTSDPDDALRGRGTPSNMVHCAIIFVEVNSMSDENGKFLAGLCQKVHRMHRDYIVVVSQAANIGASSGADIFDVDNPHRRAVLNKLCSDSNHTLDRNRIHFIENIGFDADSRNLSRFCRNLSILQILMAIQINHANRMEILFQRKPNLRQLLEETMDAPQENEDDEALRDVEEDALENDFNNEDPTHVEQTPQAARLFIFSFTTDRETIKERLTIQRNHSHMEIASAVCNLPALRNHIERSQELHIKFMDPKSNKYLADGADFFDTAECGLFYNHVLITIDDDLGDDLYVEAGHFWATVNHQFE